MFIGKPCETYMFGWVPTSKLEWGNQLDFVGHRFWLPRVSGEIAAQLVTLLLRVEFITIHVRTLHDLDSLRLYLFPSVMQTHQVDGQVAPSSLTLRSLESLIAMQALCDRHSEESCAQATSGPSSAFRKRRPFRRKWRWNEHAAAPYFTCSTRPIGRLQWFALQGHIFTRHIKTYWTILKPSKK